MATTTNISRTEEEILGVLTALSDEDETLTAREIAEACATHRGQEVRTAVRTVRRTLKRLAAENVIEREKVGGVLLYSLAA